MANTALALVAVTALWQDARAGWLLLVVAVVVLVTYRAYATLVNWIDASLPANGSVHDPVVYKYNITDSPTQQLSGTWAFVGNPR